MIRPFKLSSALSLVALAAVALSVPALSYASAPVAAAASVRQPAGFVNLSGKQHVPQAVTDGRAVYLAHAPAEQVYELAVAIPVRNEAALDKLRADQQTKGGASYHKWITVDQFADQFGASKTDYAKVVDYLKQQGFSIEFEHANRLVVSFTGTTEQVERAFHVTMNTYKHPDEDRSFYAPDREPTVSGLNVPLLLIAGLDDYVLPHSHLKNRGQMAGATPTPIKTAPEQGRADAISHATNPPVSCYGSPYSVDVGNGACNTYTPANMRTAYYPSGSLTGAGQQIGILGFGGFYPGDLTGFASVDNIATVPTVAFALGSACAASCSDGEQMLDVLWSAGIAPGITKINFFSNSSNDLTIINAEASSTASSVYSSSWGWGFGNHTAEDTDFKEMQTQGQTFLNATGDNGGYNSSTWSFPSGDPYITEVGGTQVVTSSIGGPWSAEYGWPGSSGGVPPTADAYAIPTWQVGAVNSTNGSSTTKRSDPDISAEADYEMLGCAGSRRNGNSCQDTYGGTSYAAPTWAGFIALANQASVAAGNGTIGFLNEELYETGENAAFSANFHDVTACGGIDAGESPGPDCNSSDQGTPVTGFNPVVGFDNVTGWGSPTGTALINLLTVPVLSVSAGPYLTTTSITLTTTFPEFTGTVTFTATPAAGGTAATITTCTFSNGTCSATTTGAAIGVGTYNIIAVYQETSTSTKKYSAATAITITAPPTGNITFTSVSHNFGQVSVGTAASTYGLTITNSGTTAYPFSLVFTPANGFTSANNCGTSIAAGAKCQMDFYFTPTATAPVSATWSLVAENGFTYAPSNGGTLTGSGTTSGGVSLTTAGHNFGTVAVGSTSPTYGVVLSNSTTAAVTLSLGSVTSPYASATNCGPSLAAGASCNIQFTFTPTSTSTVQQVYTLSASTPITSGGAALPNGGITLTGN